MDVVQGVLSFFRHLERRRKTLCRSLRTPCTYKPTSAAQCLPFVPPVLHLLAAQLAFPLFYIQYSPYLHPYASAMQFPIFLIFAALTVPALAHPPKPSAYPPPPPPTPKFPPGKTCPKVLVCCDSLQSPYESSASGLIDLLKVELSAAEASLGVGLTCDAIVGLGHARERRMKMKMKMKKRGLASRFRFRFAKPGHDSDGGTDGDSDSDGDGDGDDDSDDDAHDDHDEHDSYAKLAKRGVDVWYVRTHFIRQVK